MANDVQQMRDWAMRTDWPQPIQEILPCRQNCPRTHIFCIGADAIRRTARRATCARYASGARA